jgi:P27 family predicted phage terminase small subunit
MKKSTLPKAPPQLSREARRWWHRVNELYELDQPTLLILESALESFDRMRQAQAIIKAEGVVIDDRFGQKKQHPATIIERDSKQTLLRHWKALALDLEPILSPGRPSGT